MTVDELAACQGFGKWWGTHVEWEGDISSSAYGGMVGNGQTATFMLLLLPRVLFHSQQITMKEFDEVESNLRVKFAKVAGTASSSQDGPN